MDFDFGYSFGLPSVLSPFARLIPTFAGSQYGTLDAPITFAGDFEVEVEFATIASSAVVLIGKSDADTSLLYVNPTGLVTSRFGESTTNRITTTSVNDGKIHKAKMKRIGTTCSIEIDDVEEYSGVLTLADVIFDRVGNYVSGLGFQGQILNTKFTDAGTVIADIPWNSGSDTEQYYKGSSTEKVTLTNFRSEEHTSELQSQSTISYAVFCLKKKKTK